jgi:predicted GIY-YIG superfamily endonuclease
MYSIYIIKCQEDKYYIGKTERDPQIRYQKHLSGKGSIWTKKYKPKELVCVYKKCDSYDEDKYTKMYMEKYGIDNVRGGSYTTVKLSYETKEFLQKEIISAQDKCRGCGKSGHFYRYCPNKYKIKSSGLHQKISKIEKDLDQIKIVLISKYTDSAILDANKILQERIGYNLYFINKLYKEGNISEKEKNNIKNSLIDKFVKYNNRKIKNKRNNISTSSKKIIKINKKKSYKPEDSIALRVCRRRRK